MSETRTYTLSTSLSDPDKIAICTARMYWLALVLTDRDDLAADLTRKGAELLVAEPGSNSLNDWSETGARRTIIESCIHAMHAPLQADQREVAAWDDDRDALLFDSIDLAKIVSRSSIESAIRSLPVLPRFIMVIRTLNGYTLQQTSEMLLIPQSVVHLKERDIGYDFLILATGISYNYFGHDEWRRLAPGLESIEDADTIRTKFLLAFEHAEAIASAADPTDESASESIRRLLTFALVGAGTVGVEMASTLAEVSRMTLERDFRHIDPSTARILLYEAGPRILPTYPVELSEKARHHLESLGI